jgi:hypothetical protein
MYLRYSTGSLKDKNIIDMQRENFGISNYKIKKQMLNDDKDVLNIENKKKQELQRLNNNNNYDNNSNVFMINSCSKDIIARSNRYKTNLQTRVKKSYKNNKRIKKLEINKAFKNKLESIFFYSYEMSNRQKSYRCI